LQKNGRKIEDIQKIILTHNHHDHIGLVNRIRSHHHIPVYAHRDAVVRLQREPSFFNRRIDFFQALYSKMGCGKDGEIEVKRLREATIKNKDDVLHGEISLLQEGDCLDGLQVVEIPGHAADHIALFHEGSGQLLAGDHLLQHISSNALIEPDAQGQMIPSLQLYETSLKKCLKLPMTVIYPGHGEVITSPHELIKKRIDEIDRKSAKIKRVVAEQARTAAEVAQIYRSEERRVGKEGRYTRSKRDWSSDVCSSDLSLQLYETSLKKCLKLPMTVIYPGHGEVITSPHELIKKRIDEIDRKSAKIKRVVAEQARTAAEVAQIYYPNKFKTEFSLVMSEIM